MRTMSSPLSDGTSWARIWLPVDAESDPSGDPRISAYRRRDDAERDALTQSYTPAMAMPALRRYPRTATAKRSARRISEAGAGMTRSNHRLDTPSPVQRSRGHDWISWAASTDSRSRRAGHALKGDRDDRLDRRSLSDDINSWALPVGDKLSWGSTSSSINSAPPDPEIGAIAGATLWLQRLEATRLFYEWMKHRPRDTFL